MEKILQPKDVVKIKILNYLITHDEQYCDVSELEKEFCISYYLVRTLIEEIIDEIKNCSFIYQKPEIKKVEGRYRFIGEHQNIMSYLIWKYGKVSKKFELIDAFLKCKDYNLTKFSMTHYVSMSKSYQVRKELIEFFSNFDIKMSKDLKLYGNEFKIHQVLYSLYYSIFSYFEYPFSSYIESEVEKMISIISKEFKLKNNPSNLLKLKYFLSIIILRVQNKEFKIDSYKHYFVENTVVTNLTKYFTKRFRFSASEASLLYQEIKAFLTFEKYIRYESIVFTPKLSQTLFDYTDYAVSKLNKYKFFTKDINELGYVYYNLNEFIKISVLYTLCRVDPYFYYTKKSIESGYALQFAYIRDLINRYPYQDKNVLYENRNLLLNAKNLFYKLKSYLFLDRTISIKTDMVSSTNIENHIIEHLSNLLSLLPRIIFSKESQCDLLITDNVMTTTISQRVLYFSVSPNSGDWRKLAQVIDETLLQKDCC